VRTRDVLFIALRENPADDTARLALADHLEEQGETEQAELLRLIAGLRMEPESSQSDGRERRLRELLLAGVRPCVVETVNSIRMRFALIPPGSFLMGSPDDEQGRYDDEEPLHRVTLTRPFWMGVHTLTQGQYRAVMDANPSAFQPGGEEGGLVAHLDHSALPVDSVSWEEARAFCRALSSLPEERLAGRRYRLPSEAEWEYACRACTTTPFHVGDQLSTSEANFDGSDEEDELGSGSEQRRHTTPVGSFPPNAWGLYDMHGNVWEWCSDWFDEDYYHRSPSHDPGGPEEESEYHVLRGGSWFSRASVCRCACRNPVASPSATGFRVVLEHRAD
jgi:uncharacterized protein (TIGR02996 family)